MVRQAETARSNLLCYPARCAQRPVLVGLRWALGAALAALAALAACGPREASIGARSTAREVVCPTLRSSDEVLNFDFGSRFDLEAEVAHHVRAATLMAVELVALGERVDGQVGPSCAQLARDLGAGGGATESVVACTKAYEAVRSLVGTFGPRARLLVQPPSCLADAHLMTKCVSLCDTQALASQAKSACQERGGTCEGTCEGECAPKTFVKCTGNCTGMCEGLARGTCTGRCDGRCGGVESHGECDGVCEGVCSGGLLRGTCEGRCGGMCTLEGGAVCDGVCAGRCSVEFSDERCAGCFDPPQAREDCRLGCDVLTMTSRQCSVPRVGIFAGFAGSKTAKAGDARRAAVALGTSLPPLIRVLSEVGEQGPDRVRAAQEQIDGVRVALPGLMHAPRPTLRGGADVNACLAPSFERASAAAVRVREVLERAEAIRALLRELR